jgi:hypothetical protein
LFWPTLLTHLKKGNNMNLHHPKKQSIYVHHPSYFGPHSTSTKRLVQNAPFEQVFATALNLRPDDNAQSRAGGVKLTKMMSFPWSSAATSIVLYNRAHHPSSYAFDGGGAGAIHMAGRPRPCSRGGTSTLLSSSVVVVNEAPPTLLLPLPTTHHQ